MDEMQDNMMVPQDQEEQVDPMFQWTEKLTEDYVSEKLKNYNSTWDAYSPDLYNKMKTWYKLYRSMDYGNQKVSTKIPEIFALIETELPHLLNSLFSRSNIVDANPKFVDTTDRTDKIKAYINKLIKDTCDGRRKTELIIKNMLIYGWSIVKMEWNTDPDKDVNPMTGEVVYIDSAHPDFYMVDPFSFAWEPNYDGQKIDKIEWVRERINLSKNKMKQMRDNGECGDFDDNDMEADANSNEGKKVRKKDSTETKKKNDTFYDEFYATLYDEVPKLDEMTGEDTGKKKTIAKEYRIWFLANNKIIKFEPNVFQFKPFAITRCYSNPNEFLGQGESEVLAALATQLSYTHLQAGKLVKKLGQQLTLIDPSAGISPENINRIEEGVLFVRNLDGMRSEQTNDPQTVNVLVKFKEYLNTEMERITGIGPQLQGEIEGDITATQASIVQQNASNRLANKLTHLQEDFLVPLAETFFLMNKQLLTVPVEFFDSNNNLIQLTPEDFNGNYNWVSNGSVNQANKALQLQQNQQILQVFTQIAQMSQNQAISVKPMKLDFPYILSQQLAPFAGWADVTSMIEVGPPFMPAIPQGQAPGLMPPNPQQSNSAPNPAPVASPENSPEPPPISNDINKTLPANGVILSPQVRV